MTEPEQQSLTASEKMLAGTFDTWRKEFREILEDHRRQIQDRLEKIEREIEKKSDKENVEVLVRSINSDLHRHTEEIDKLHARVSEKVGTETMWKIVGLMLAIGTGVGTLVGFLLNLLLR